MFKFWYEYIPKATSVIEMGQGEAYYKKVVKPVLHSFMGSVFEEMCRYYTLIKGIAGEYGCFVTSVGTWWGVENIIDKDGQIRAQSADIDVVALSEIDKKAIIGECKYYEEHPNWYTGEYWWGVKDLPEVNETDPEFMEFVCGENGVVRHWLRMGASGFRLDVADELPDAFIEAVRKALKAEKEDAVLIGEVWEDASNKISYGARRKFVLGRQLDGAMNYPLRADILDFASLNIDAWKFAQRINSRLENYPKEAFWGNFNLIGSHDRERALSVFEGDKEKLKISAVLSYVLPGAPVIYYGDEAGLTGAADPDNRRSYPWGYEDTELIDFYTELGRKYKACPALALGNLKIFAEDKYVVVIERELNGVKTTIKIDALSKSYDII